MAVSFKNAGKVTRGDVFFIEPKYVHVDPLKRGRKILPSQEDVESLAKSFLKVGQSQPVLVRKRPGDKELEIVLGFTRHEAASWLVENGHDFRLKCIVVEGNDEELFLKNIAENRERNSTNPVDDAFNQRRLREEFGYDDKRIAEEYRMGESRVRELKKLLTLPADIQAEVGGLIAPAAAILMAELPVAQQRELVRNYKSMNAAVLAAVKGEVKGESAAVNADGDADEKPVPKASGKPGKKASKPAGKKSEKKIGVAQVKKAARESGDTHARTDRSLKEVKQFFSERFADNDEDQPVRVFAKAFLRFCKGEIDDAALTQALHDLESEG